MLPFPLRSPVPIIRQWWYRLWIREDEFDISLSMDLDYLYDIMRKIAFYEQFYDAQRKLNYWKAKKSWYTNDLCRRREIAHREDMKRDEKRLLEETDDGTGHA